MTDKPTKRREPPKPRTIALPDRKTCQPPKAGWEKEYDMPGAPLKTIRRAFFRPVIVRREGAG